MPEYTRTTVELFIFSYITLYAYYIYLFDPALLFLNLVIFKIIGNDLCKICDLTQTCISIIILCSLYCKRCHFSYFLVSRTYSLPGQRPSCGGTTGPAHTAPTRSSSSGPDGCLALLCYETNAIAYQINNHFYQFYEGQRTEQLVAGSV